MKLLVGIPTKPNHPHLVFREQVVEAINKALEEIDVIYDVYFTENEGSCADAHNLIYDKARAEDYDYVWTVDADVLVPVNAFKDLLSDGVDIALGSYELEAYKKYLKQYGVEAPSFKDLMISGTVWVDPGDKTYHHHLFKRQEFEGQILLQHPLVSNEAKVLFGGQGCALVSRKILDSDIRHHDMSPGIGHDLLFQYECYQRGFSMALDGRVICEHLD